MTDDNFDFEEFKKFVRQQVDPLTDNLTSSQRDYVRNLILYSKKFEDLENNCLKILNEYNIQINLNGLKKKYGFGIRLSDVYEIYEKWLNIPDKKRIDVGFAVKLSSQFGGRTRIWIIFIAPSGDMKSEQINALDDGEKTVVLLNLTSKTLVSGNPKVPDLAPELDNKTVLIKDMSQILKLHPNEKGEVWAQLRDLYDGCAGKCSGVGKRARYEGLNVTLIAGSTPEIDNQILIYQSLGTRELLWRVKSKDVIEQKRTMDKCWVNEEYEDEMVHELKEISNFFIKSLKIKKIIISTEIRNKIDSLCMYLRLMRAPANHDSFTGELIGNITPEDPTRLQKQLKRLYVCLKSLDENYSDENALLVLEHAVNSSCDPIRLDVLNLLLNSIKDKEIIPLNQLEIAKKLRLGTKTVFRELSALWNLDLIKRIDREIQKFGRVFNEMLWYINLEHSLIKEKLKLILEENNKKLNTNIEVKDVKIKEIY